MNQPPAQTRTVSDSFGTIDVPADALWGAQTERSRRFFAIGHQRMPMEIIHALAEVKRAAAEVNGRLGLLEPRKAAAIAAAAARVAAGGFDDQFPLSVWQTGSGTQSNMNVNEVVAHLASIGDGETGQPVDVHPNDDVNRGQSSNDVFPTAMHVAVVLMTRPLLTSLARLRAALGAKAVAFADIIKIGRTHTQDATPLTLGQEFGGYAAQVRYGIERLQSCLPRLAELPLGGTAVGTGINTPAGFSAREIGRAHV